jgi:hypothetical protein
MIAKKKLNHPLLKKSFNFLPLTIPISSKNIAKSFEHICCKGGYLRLVDH